MLQAKYSIADKEVKKSVRRDYRKRVEELAKKAEEAERNNENKELYKITTILSNRRWIRNRQVRDKKRELLTFPEMLNIKILKEVENEKPNVTHEENSNTYKYKSTNRSRNKIGPETDNNWKSTRSR